jgi:hypothetical protein
MLHASLFFVSKVDVDSRYGSQILAKTRAYPHYRSLHGNRIFSRFLSLTQHPQWCTGLRALVSIYTLMKINNLFPAISFVSTVSAGLSVFSMECTFLANHDRSFILWKLKCPYVITTFKYHTLSFPL